MPSPVLQLACRSSVRVGLDVRLALRLGGELFQAAGRRLRHLLVAVVRQPRRQRTSRPAARVSGQYCQCCAMPRTPFAPSSSYRPHVGFIDALAAPCRTGVERTGHPRTHSPHCDVDDSGGTRLMYRSSVADVPFSAPRAPRRGRGPRRAAPPRPPPHPSPLRHRPGAPRLEPAAAAPRGPAAARHAGQFRLRRSTAPTASGSPAAPAASRWRAPPPPCCSPASTGTSSTSAGRTSPGPAAAELPRPAARPAAPAGAVGDRAAPLRAQRHPRRLHRPVRRLGRAGSGCIDVLALHGFNEVLVTAGPGGRLPPPAAGLRLLRRRGARLDARPLPPAVVAAAEHVAGTAARCPRSSSTSAPPSAGGSPTGCASWA